MKSSLFVVGMFATTAVLGCSPPGVAGSGNPKTETRPLATFDEVDFSGAGSLEFTIGQPQTFEITCDDNLLPLIETKVVDGKLGTGKV